MPNRRAIPKDAPTKALELYRTNRRITHAAVAKALGIDARTARKFYEVGFNGQPPIRDLVTAERLQAEAAEADRLKLEAKQEQVSVETVAKKAEVYEETVATQELRLSMDLRKLAQAWLITGDAISHYAMKLGVRLANLNANPQATEVEMTAAVASASRVVREGFGLARMAVEVERIRRGEPVETIRVETTPMPTQEQLREQFEFVKREYAATLEMEEQHAADPAKLPN